ncbi:tetratricopeptide repeat-containing sensor histidine kinase [Pedobacter heparinus]|uniref:tetratricopeptide repeat-containing sensor histidine kinase n=1 Tax=Pedobacter heparinus TaxID=984 RepID=UPI00292F6997|nr:tetratricopeptide repeat-containing sensor histidine kinase [Pedobacter heparinus]
MMLRICTFLFFWIGICLIATGCNGQVPVVEADSPQVHHVKVLISAARKAEAKGDHKSALHYHKQVLHRSRNLGLPEQEAKALLGIGRLLKNEDTDKSMAHLRSALTIAELLKNHELRADIYLAIASVYKQQQDYREALAALESHQKLLNTIFAKSKQLAIAHVKVEEKRKLERSVFITVIIFVILLGIIGLFYFLKKNALNKKLASSNQTKDKLFSIIGHDLRNPIGGITQLLAIMDEGQLDPKEYQAMVSEMRKQGDISLEILNALLNWGEAQLKGIHIKPSNFNAEGVIARNITALGSQASAKSILITNSVGPDITVYGDTNHFDFVVRNLLSNAIKFSLPSGKIEIRTDAHSKPDLIIFSVMDYGKGISKAQQELFLKDNLDISFGTAGEKGTGIGLMLSKEFIKANHGRIWVESEEGKGSTFYFSFPKGSLD